MDAARNRDLANRLDKRGHFHLPFSTQAQTLLSDPQPNHLVEITRASQGHCVRNLRLRQERLMKKFANQHESRVLVPNFLILEGGLLSWHLTSLCQLKLRLFCRLPCDTKPEQRANFRRVLNFAPGVTHAHLRRVKYANLIASSQQGGRGGRRLTHWGAVVIEMEINYKKVSSYRV